MIPAEPGYTYIELDELNGKVFISQRHPVIAWVEAGGHGGDSFLALLPMMVVKRADKDWGVQYPNGLVIGDDGSRYDNIGHFTHTAQEILEYVAHQDAEREKAKEPA